LFSLDEVGDSLIDSYSHGMQQKTSLAAALMHDPKVLCSTSRRSARSEIGAPDQGCLRQLADRGSAVFVSTHILEIAERMCDRIGIINRGQLIAVAPWKSCGPWDVAKRALRPRPAWRISS